MKLCSRCKQEKSLSEFRVKGDNKNGTPRVDSWCIPCHKEYKHNHYRENKDQILEQQRQYYEKNKDRLRPRREAYREANKDKKRETDRVYREQNREKRSAYHKEYASDPANRDNIRKIKSRWKQRNPDKVLGHVHQRRARRLGLPEEDFLPSEIFERDGWVCYLCELPVLRFVVTGRHPLGPTMDHVIPLSYVGPDNPGHVRTNVKLAHNRCNSSKHAKMG